MGFLALIAPIVLTLMMAGCGGEGVESQGEKSVAKPPAPPSPPAATPAEREKPASAKPVAAPPKPEKPPEEREGMAYIPAGEFLMGSADDDRLVYPWELPRQTPQHTVYLDAFYMDKTEVTNAQFEKWRPKKKRHEWSPCDDCPVTRVNWYDARDYCEAHGKRLPTEAEWEKAAKGAGKTGLFAASVWYAGNSNKRTQPVGQKDPNGYGLHDMLGNVREWTSTWYDPSYYGLRVRDNPKGPADGKRRVERGGAFFLPRRGITTEIRYNHPPRFRLYFLGFRCVQDP